jgi:hypothetical protein
VCYSNNNVVVQFRDGVTKQNQDNARFAGSWAAALSHPVAGETDETRGAWFGAVPGRIPTRLLMDEPFAALDAQNVQSCQNTKSPSSPD